MKRRGFAALGRRDMIFGYHFIFSAYGFWLPNDPRGSWSETIRKYELLAFGPATKVSTSRSLANVPHDKAIRNQAKKALKYPPVRFTGIQARAIGHGFRTAAQEAGYHIVALAMLKHPRDIEQIAAHMKARATRQLNDEGIHPLAAHAGKDDRVPSPWARGYWCPFVESNEHMRQLIAYIEANPSRAGLPPQQWRVVEPVEKTR